jgi:hypothetical protein
VQQSVDEELLAPVFAAEATIDTDSCQMLLLQEVLQTMIRLLQMLQYLLGLQELRQLL